MAASTPFYLALALVVLVATVPMLAYFVRFLSAPWSTLATRFPGAAQDPAAEISYVTARFRRSHLPFSLTRCVRIRAVGGSLGFSVIGFDFLPARLSAFLIPRGAISECTPCDLLIARQKVVVREAAVTIMIYGRGAEFVRTWWDSGSQ